MTHDALSIFINPPFSLLRQILTPQLSLSANIDTLFPPNLSFTSLCGTHWNHFYDSKVRCCGAKNYFDIIHLH